MVGHPPQADNLGSRLMYYVYVLKSRSTGTRYIGQTDNLQRRLYAHNAGYSRYTKARGPWDVVHVENYTSRREAIVREKFLKSGKGREILDNLAQ